MQVVHESADGAETVLATDVDVADTILQRARGLMFRRSVPEDYALAFQFRRPAPRGIHMVFVPVPLDVVWVVDGTVQQVSRLRPWVGLGRARADLLLELRAGGAADVAPGDTVRLTRSR